MRLAIGKSGLRQKNSAQPRNASAAQSFLMPFGGGRSVQQRSLEPSNIEGAQDDSARVETTDHFRCARRHCYHAPRSCRRPRAAAHCRQSHWRHQSALWPQDGGGEDGADVAHRRRRGGGLPQVREPALVLRTFPRRGTTMEMLQISVEPLEEREGRPAGPWQYATDYDLDGVADLGGYKMRGATARPTSTISSAPTRIAGKITKPRCKPSTMKVSRSRSRCLVIRARRAAGAPYSPHATRDHRARDRCVPPPLSPHSARLPSSVPSSRDRTWCRRPRARGLATCEQPTIR